MKKKNLKNLTLRAYKVSNLALLPKQKGGDLNTDTNIETDTDYNGNSILYTCITEYRSCIFSDCATNGGDTKVPPPTEYETCDALGFGG